VDSDSRQSAFTERIMPAYRIRTGSRRCPRTPPGRMKFPVGPSTLDRKTRRPFHRGRERRQSKPASRPEDGARSRILRSRSLAWFCQPQPSRSVLSNSSSGRRERPMLRSTRTSRISLHLLPCVPMTIDFHPKGLPLPSLEEPGLYCD